jgi:hypothetical protein
METKWASLVSYGLTAQALKDFLPVDATLNATAVSVDRLYGFERFILQNIGAKALRSR